MQGLFKGPTHKFSFTGTCLGLRQGQGQTGVEMPEERLGMEALGRELRVAAGILVLSHPPDSNSLCAQADHSLLSGSSLRGNSSSDPRRVSALALWCLSLTAET